MAKTVIIQIEKISDQDVQRLASIFPASLQIAKIKKFIGQEFLELVIKLKDVDLNALSLGIGFILGLGTRIVMNLTGRPLENPSLKELQKELKKLKKQDLRPLPAPTVSTTSSQKQKKSGRKKGRSTAAAVKPARVGKKNAHS